MSKVKAIKMPGAGKFGLFAVFILCLSHTHLYSQLFIEAENYTAMFGVQTEGTQDAGGGINVGWIDNNDWMEYVVDIPIAGDYKIDFRIASMNGGGVIQVKESDVTLVSVAVPKTNGWQNWQTVSSTSISLSEGEQTIRLFASPAGFNLNWWQLVLTNPVDTDAPTTPVFVFDSTSVHDVILRWTASTDTTSVVASYKILKDNAPFALSSDTFIHLTKLPPDQLLNLSVLATDLAGNASDTSNISVSTLVPDWDLIWFDEFDGSSVNTSKWNLSTGPNNANNEEQYYTPANATVVDGKLVISSKIEAMGGYDYTSAKLTSYSKGDWLYGRIDIKAKLPAAGGTWPAIWMMPTTSGYGSWPNSGEIDIMEHVGNNLGWVFGTVHTGAYNHTLGTQKGGGLTILDVAETFHEYSIEWYPDHIDFYIDDINYFSFTNEYKTYMEWPYDMPFYLILNIAVGGDLGGNVDLSDTWPSTMEVDYVRVYDLKFGINDSIAPGEPSNLTADPAATNMTIAWDPASDNEYIKMYNVFQDGILSDSSAGTSIKVVNLEPLTEYTFGIQSVDFGGNLSDTVYISASTIALESFAVPGLIQAENYIYMEGIQTQTTTDAGGGLNVGYFDSGDWMSYSVNVTAEDEYRIAYREAEQSAVGVVQLSDADGNELVSTSLPVTGGWQNWQTVISEPFTLTAGIQTIKVSTNTGGFNLNWFEIKGKDDFVGIDAISAIRLNIYPNPVLNGTLTIDLAGDSQYQMVSLYSTDGKLLYNEKFTGSTHQLEISLPNLSEGVYFLSVITDRSNYIQSIEVR